MQFSWTKYIVQNAAQADKIYAKNRLYGKNIYLNKQLSWRKKMLQNVAYVHETYN